MRRVFAFFILVFFILQFFAILPRAYAQANDSSGIAVYIPVQGKNVQQGDIVSVSKDGYILSNIPYDPNIFGVVVKDPAVAFETDQKGAYPVVSQGKVLMRVSTANGNIKKGDLLTSSSSSGVAEKATESGFIIATALEDYSDKKVGTILVVLDVGHGTVSNQASGNLLKTFNFIFRSPYMSPLSLLRYIFAATMVILSFVVAIGYFGRISSLGIQALGRNPLAGRLIIFSIIIHVALAMVIIGVGIAVAYLVLVM